MNELIHFTNGDVYLPIGREGNTEEQSYPNIEGTYVQHGTYTISYLTDWRHKHTHKNQAKSSLY